MVELVIEIEEDKEMANNKIPASRGYYTYEDGYTHWVNGMSATEKKWEIMKHGKIVKFVHTN